MSFRRILSFVVGVFLVPLGAHAQGVIGTVAGAQWVFTGNGGPAVNAPLSYITSVTTDAGGNVFFVDTYNFMVMKVSPNGILTVVAGNGTQGFSGDGGPATSASLQIPSTVAVDASGNIYVWDSARVRKVSTSGIITTFAGTGIPGFSGDGGPATSAAITGSSAITNAGNGLAVDSQGNVHNADSNNHRERKIAPNRKITTIAGNRAQGFSGDGGPAAAAALNFPSGVAVDSSGALYIADDGNHRVRKIPRGGVISTIAGNGQAFASGDGGPAVSASLSDPYSVAVDSAGNVLIGERFANLVRRVNTSGLINLVAGAGNGPTFAGDGGPALQASFSTIGGVAADAAGNIYVADRSNKRVRKINTAGIISTFAGNGQFRISGDGGPATSAYLGFQYNLPHIALDSAGNLYIADTLEDRIRKVTPAGLISTIAGTGVLGVGVLNGTPTATSFAIAEPLAPAVDASGNVYICLSSGVFKISTAGLLSQVVGGNGYGGDGGPASSANVSTPDALAFDRAGNLYVAGRSENRIRKISTSGVITTYAGNGNAGYSGDGGPATSATLNSPNGLTVDGIGNVYISDTNNAVIRKVTPAGVITTFAGTGTPGFSGDGGPATSARICNNQGITTDLNGNVYIADSCNSRIRRVATDGTISTVAGGGTIVGDGASALQASLSPSDVAVDSAGNIYIASRDSVRKVLAAAPSFVASPTTLTFTAPATTSTPVSQQISTASTVSGLVYSVQSSTTDGNPWLTFSPAFGYSPSGITVSANAAKLQPGTYQGTITIQEPLAATPNQNVAVQFTVTPATPPSLTLSASSMQFDYLTGVTTLAPRALTLANSGGGSLSWTAAASTDAGGNWLTVSPASGSSTAAAPGVAQISVNPSGLAAGAYTGTIAVQSATTGQSFNVTITLVVTQPQPTLLVSQSGLLFTTVAGGGGVPPQTIGIINTGQTAMNWTAAASTISGGQWLSVSPANGTSQPNSLQVPLATVAINASSLAAGTYYGVVTIAAPGARNAPQAVTVVLNVLPAGSNPGVLVRPTGLIFTTTQGTTPAAQSVMLNTPVPGSLGFAQGFLTFDGGTWLASGTQNSVLQSGVPLTVNVQPSVSGLSSGVRRGTLTLLFADGTSQTVNVLFLVVNGGTSEANDRRSLAAAACNPTQLLGGRRSLQNGAGYATSVGYPVSLEVQLTDDCANVVTNATVTATFSNGDPPVALASLGTGVYTGTWQPQSAGGSTFVQITAQAPSLPALNLPAVQFGVSASTSAPIVGQGGIVNGASFAAGAPVAPGSIVSVFGQQLGSSPAAAQKVPLPTTLGGVSVNVGGLNAPLFYDSNGQINAQVPFETPQSSQQQVVVLTPSAAAVPQSITVVPARPGIFLAPTSATPNQGAIVTPAGVLINAASPATAGDVVLIYATGLGAVDQPVTTGAPPQTNPVPNAVVVPKVAISGQSAAVQFAGLAPGFVGLYQINVQVPANTSKGNAVPLVLTQNGVASNTVTLAIK